MQIPIQDKCKCVITTFVYQYKTSTEKKISGMNTGEGAENLGCSRNKIRPSAMLMLI